MKLSKLTIALSLWSALAFAEPHGGNGQDLGGNPGAQMASEGGGEGSGPDGGSAPSGPAPLSAPTTVANGTMRSVPERPGSNKNPVAVLHESFVEPRSPASMKIYEGAYNADTSLVNQWLKSFKK